MRPPAQQGRREKKFLCSKRCVRVLTKRRASIIIISTMTKDTGRDKAAEGGYGIFADLHTHTTYSHGKGSVEDNVRAAKFRGLSCLAVTDHGVRHPLVGVKREKFAAMRRDVSAAAEKYGRNIFRSSLRTTAFVNELSIYLNELLAPTETIHGVLVDLFGVGVLIIGNSSIGKSETALELIQRGHRLVADDAVCLKRVNDRLVGSAPVKIRHLMEIRGLGIIDVEKMYGSGSVRQTKMVDFVACLEDWNEEKQYDRLGDETHTYNILDIDMPEYIIPVRPGRNVASILEAAARNFRAKLLGYNVMDELMYRAILERKH